MNRIRSVAVVGGFLDGFRAELAGDLTCVIGARGTGKTTLLELVRFALDAMPSTDGDFANCRRIEKLLEKNLNGGRVEIDVENKDGLRYTVTRALNEPPIVLDAEHRPVDMSVRGLIEVDVYSQNEIENIADRPVAQLALLDKFEANKIAAIEHELAEVRRELDANAGRIVPLLSQSASLTDELAAMPEIETKLRHFRSRAARTTDIINQAHAKKALRDRKQRAIAALAEALAECKAAVEEQIGGLAEEVESIFDEELTAGPDGAEMKAVQKMVLTAAGNVDAQLDAAGKELAATLTRLEKHSKDMKKVHDQQELAFRRLIEKHEDAQEQSTERTRLERARNELLMRRRTHRDVSRQLRALQDERKQLLDRQLQLLDQRFLVRKHVTKRISAELKGNVLVGIKKRGNIEQYEAMLAEALRKAPLKANLMATRLAEALTPWDLADLVREHHLHELAKVAKIELSQARRVLEALGNSKLLYKLETVELPDLPSIELFDERVYKPAPQLSTGQKCTAVLPILLLESENPLIVDQPEDNLDNRFVYECVVSRIADIKARRQLIFVTHNPNIPVLGDASRVLVLDSDGSAARLSLAGNLDECRTAIVTLLEGGAEAFQRRGDRYGFRETRR